MVGNRRETPAVRTFGLEKLIHIERRQTVCRAHELGEISDFRIKGVDGWRRDRQSTMGTKPILRHKGQGACRFSWLSSAIWSSIGIPDFRDILNVVESCRSKRGESHETDDLQHVARNRAQTRVTETSSREV